MIRTTIFPGRYVQGEDALQRLGTEMERYGEKGFVLCDPYVMENLLDTFKEAMEREVDIEISAFGGECSDKEIEEQVNKARNSSADLVAGIGGGKTLDTAKAVAHELKCPVVIVPTLASTDAPCSALSVIYTAEGEFKRYLFLPRNPDMVLIDTKLVAQSPTRFFVSGMGDALATWFEAQSCKTNYAGNMTGDLGSMTAYALAHLCYQTLIEYGDAAKKACDANAITPAFDHVVEANTLLSGLGFESGGLAAAHALHNGLTVLEKTHDANHGEKVAIGTLTSLILTDKPQDLIDEVYSFCESVGLPTTLEDIGLKKVSDGDLKKVAEATCAEGETIHNEPMPVTPEQVVSALKTMDQIGRQRKQ